MKLLILIIQLMILSKLSKSKQFISFRHLLSERKLPIYVKNIELNHIQSFIKMFDKKDQIKIFEFDQDDERFYKQISINQTAESFKQKRIINYENNNNGTIHIKAIHVSYIRPKLSYDINWYYLPDTVEIISMYDSFDLQEMNLNGLTSSSSINELRICSNSGLKRIDLSSLIGLTSLKYIRLYRNKLKTLDLRPLNGLTALEHIDLSDNKLETLDLRPLNGLTALRYIDLSHNNLETLDLRPLSGLTALQYIYLGFNKLEILDLRPLSGLTALQSIDVSWNRLETLDLTPLSGLTSLNYFPLFFNRFVRIPDLSPLNGIPSLYIPNHPTHQTN